jgi:hypothetical protein
MLGVAMAPGMIRGACAAPASFIGPPLAASLSRRSSPVGACDATSAPRRAPMTELSRPRRSAGLAGFDAYTLALSFYRGILDVARRAPDVLFLDIDLGGESGFDVLGARPGDPLVVFVTAYEEFAVRLEGQRDALVIITGTNWSRTHLPALTRLLATSYHVAFERKVDNLSFTAWVSIGGCR